MSKYAIYVVLIEDTEANDQSLAERVDSLERLGGNLDYEEAEERLADFDAFNHEIAK